MVKLSKRNLTCWWSYYASCWVPPPRRMSGNKFMMEGYIKNKKKINDLLPKMKRNGLRINDASYQTITFWEIYRQIVVLYDINIMY